MEKGKQQSVEQYRISVDDSHHSTYQELAKKTDRQSTEKDQAIHAFESMKNLFMLATFIGYNSDKRIPIERGTGIFNWRGFSTDEVSLLDALAVTVTDEVEVLSDRIRILQIAEEFANGGILQIEEEVREMPGDRIDNLVDLLAKLMQEGSLI